MDPYGSPFRSDWGELFFPRCTVSLQNVAVCIFFFIPLFPANPRGKGGGLNTLGARGVGVWGGREARRFGSFGSQGAGRFKSLMLGGVFREFFGSPYWFLLLQRHVIPI